MLRVLPVELQSSVLVGVEEVSPLKDFFLLAKGIENNQFGLERKHIAVRNPDKEDIRQYAVVVHSAVCGLGVGCNGNKAAMGRLTFLDQEHIAAKAHLLRLIDKQYRPFLFLVCAQNVVQTPISVLGSVNQVADCESAYTVFHCEADAKGILAVDCVEVFILIASALLQRGIGELRKAACV